MGFRVYKGIDGHSCYSATNGDKQFVDTILDNILLERYPEIYAGFSGDRKWESAMASGSSCGNGWFDIIDSLCAVLKNNHWIAKIQYKSELERYNKTDEEIADLVEKKGEHMQRPSEPPEEPLPVAAIQIKERYGELQFYYCGGWREEDQGAVRMAEAISGRTCEVCGNAGKINCVDGVFSCRCDRCENIDRTDMDKYYKDLKVIEEKHIARILKMDEERKELVKEGWITEDE
jgi:hypothetical protein